MAARRGINRAQAEISLQRANRLDDVFFFYDPLTYQYNSPQRLKSGRSWIIALTFPLPIYNRNQGNIAKSPQQPAPDPGRALGTGTAGGVRGQAGQARVSKLFAHHTRPY